MQCVHKFCGHEHAFITVCQYHYALPIMAFSEISISKTDPLPTSESTMISQLWALHILLHKKGRVQILLHCVLLPVLTR